MFNPIYDDYIFALNAKYFRELTPQNKSNLATLADFLVTLPSIKFSLESFVDTPEEYTNDCHYPDSPRVADGSIYNACGATACAVGYLPLIFKNAPDYPSNLGSFNDLSIELLGVDNSTPLWGFLFSASIAVIDNTPIGCANRIRHVLSEEGEISGKSMYLSYLTKHNLLSDEAKLTLATRDSFND